MRSKQAFGARERVRCVGRLSAAPLVSNHDAIMILLVSHNWHSASEAPVAGGRRAWRAIKPLTSDALKEGGRHAWRAIERRPPLGSSSVSNHDVIVMQS